MTEVTYDYQWVLDAKAQREAGPIEDTPKGIAAKPNEEAPTKEQDFLEKMYDRLVAGFTDEEEAIDAMAGKKPSREAVQSSVLDEMGELARRSAEEAALERMEQGITESRDSLPSRVGNGIMSATKDGQESAPTTAETSFDFEDTTSRLMEDLKRDFGLNGMQAAALVGNLAVETDNFNTLQEYKPVVEGSRGGYGFAQWTGERRIRYEAWAKENELDPASYEANYGYLKYELSNTDPEIGNMGKNTIKRLKKATDINAATDIVMKGYLRPGTPHLDKRQASAATILGMTQ